jgi:homoserine acetyltransferase
VEVGQEKWGTFNQKTSKAVLHAGAKTGDEDLIDFAAIQTLGGGGKVYAINREKMPDKEPVAALFRY